MNNLDTIDKKLRAKARRECEARLDQGVAQFVRLFTSCTDNLWIKIEFRRCTVRPEDTYFKMRVSHVIALLRAKLEACECPAHEQAAVDNFLVKVEQLEKEVEDLQNEINR